MIHTLFLVSRIFVLDRFLVSGIEQCCADLVIRWLGGLSWTLQIKPLKFTAEFGLPGMQHLKEIFSLNLIF